MKSDMQIEPTACVCVCAPPRTGRVCGRRDEEQNRCYNASFAPTPPSAPPCPPPPSPPHLISSPFSSASLVFFFICQMITRVLHCAARFISQHTAPNIPHLPGSTRSSLSLCLSPKPWPKPSDCTLGSLCVHACACVQSPDCALAAVRAADGYFLPLRKS